MTQQVRDEIDRRLAPWTTALGADRTAYTNHVLRMLEFCDVQHARVGGSGGVPSTREEFLTAAAFHDLGIWSAGTFDYLPPSIDLARTWLVGADRADLVPLVTEMIAEHHKIRSAGERGSAVEIFRRADTTDASLGALRFGLSFRDYRDVARRYPNAGFHKRLLALIGNRLRTHPTSPLPMVTW